MPTQLPAQPELEDSNGLPPDDATPKSGSWLARSRRFAILGGTIIALVGVMVATTLINRPEPANLTTTESIAQSGTNRPTFERYPTAVRIDQDGDGLTDDEESQAGTRPDLADTDGDGLSDREEIIVYQTDPKRQDSDGDGQTDATEIAAGQNPNGPGLLRDLNQAIQQLNQSE